MPFDSTTVTARKIRALCKEFADIFYVQGDILSHTTLAEHRIPIHDGTAPVFTRQYRIPERQQIEVDRQVEDLCKQGIIEPSTSPWNSPILIVNKKDDRDGKKQFRVVIDLRKINELSDSQSFPIPLVEEIIVILSGNVYFSTLDSHNAYYQILLHKYDRKYTAVQTSKGKFQFCKIPMGIKSSSMTYQHAINIALAKILGIGAYSYLDDIIVFGKTMAEHQKSINQFLALRKHNFKLKMEKSHFLKRKVTYLGHTITKNETSPDINKTVAISSYLQPKNEHSFGHKAARNLSIR